MLKKKKIKAALFSGAIFYLIGCALLYFTWYKNGLLLHYSITALIVGGTLIFLVTFRDNSSIFKIFKHKALITLLFTFLFVGFAGWIFSLENKRVSSILENNLTKQVIANVISVDFRATRSGKQPWYIINYKVDNQIIEQSFADTAKNLSVGRKYLIEYSVEYPDMFRVLKDLK